MIKNYRTVAKLGLIAAILTSVSGSAFAQRYAVQPRAQDFSALYGAANSSDYIAAYNRSLQGTPCGIECGPSGTAGRLGLGASAFHPEGSGNLSD